MFRRFLAAAFLMGAAAAVVQAEPAQACSCAAWEPDSTPEQREAKATEFASAVFVGEATSSRVDDGDDDPETQSSGDRRDVAFSVRRVVKGPVTNPFEISTASDGATCGKNFHTGVLYKVFADEHQGRFWVSLCSATRVATEADLVEPTAATTTPPAPTTTRPPPESTTTTTTSPPATEPAPTTTSSTVRPESGDVLALESRPTSTSTPAGLFATALLLLLAVTAAAGLRTWRGRRS